MSKDDLKREVTCSNCGEILHEDLSQAPSPPCPKCGSVKRTVHVFLSDRVEMYDMLEGKLKDPSRKSKDKERVKFKTGDDLHRKSGKWYDKKQRIDRDSDMYEEVIIDPETGEIVHQCKEPLSEHRGHGSAKNAGKKRKK